MPTTQGPRRGVGYDSSHDFGDVLNMIRAKSMWRGEPVFDQPMGPPMPAQERVAAVPAVPRVGVPPPPIPNPMTTTPPAELAPVTRAVALEDPDQDQGTEELPMLSPQVSQIQKMLDSQPRDNTAPVQFSPDNIAAALSSYKDHKDRITNKLRQGATLQDIAQAFAMATGSRGSYGEAMNAIRAQTIAEQSEMAKHESNYFKDYLSAANAATPKTPVSKGFGVSSTPGGGSVRINKDTGEVEPIPGTGPMREKPSIHPDGMGGFVIFDPNTQTTKPVGSSGVEHRRQIADENELLTPEAAGMVREGTGLGQRAKGVLGQVASTIGLDKQAQEIANTPSQIAATEIRTATITLKNMFQSRGNPSNLEQNRILSRLPDPDALLANQFEEVNKLQKTLQMVNRQQNILSGQLETGGLDKATRSRIINEYRLMEDAAEMIRKIGNGIGGGLKSTTGAVPGSRENPFSDPRQVTAPGQYAIVNGTLSVSK